MTSCEVKSELLEGIPVLRVKGYYEKPAGQQVSAAAESFCQVGKCALVLDLSECDILTSPGVSTIVELAIGIADHYQGKLFICGLDKLKEKILTLAGIQSTAVIAGSLAEARQAAARWHRP